ncbi:MAG: gamma-glutamyl-gamma-aminobutyrate hydrolase family protein [Desulfomonile tiedjei]|uniref:Gamma-glutamyl-gamma-aminobutyrate hydrolase family protein n=1 Tax=Desulfomonile tiedjei TaxID=2358 RepID=A0A9D6Z2L2_9BACT|nr:gamma-glutamyl-gamma-aminobutyrate hydrolase family protein [Desulfomonile tiedjei]
MAVVLVVLSVGIAPGTERKDSDNLKPRSAEPTVQPANLWIVVNLFTGRTSRQAEKVRDILSGLGAEGRGIVLPYNEITVENMKRLRPSFLALSPNGMPWCKYRGRNGTDLESFFRALKTIVEEMEIPVMGICGGHQALALAFGGKVGPIRGGEDDCLPYGHNPTERGRHNVFVVTEDPLFQGMGKAINLVQNHYDEVKRLPPGFLCLAENKLCPYQIIKHPTKPAYGVQAHTEYYLRNKPDGGLLLQNFLKIARTHNSIARSAESGPTAGSKQKEERETSREALR